MPMTMSRGLQFCHVAGPLQPTARVPPMVARSGRGGSIARNWPCSAEDFLEPRDGDARLDGGGQVGGVVGEHLVDAGHVDGEVERFGGLPRRVRVLPPKGETERPCCEATDIASDISCGEVGHATTPGTFPSTVYSVVAIPVRVSIDSERREAVAASSREEFTDTGSMLIRRRWPPSWRTRRRDGAFRERRLWGRSCRG